MHKYNRLFKHDDSDYLSISENNKGGAVLNGTEYLDETKEIYNFSPDYPQQPIESTINVGDFMFNVKSDSYKQVTATKNGKISISGNTGDCTLGIFTELLHDCFPWYTVDVYNYSDTTKANLYYTKDGLIYDSDSMEYVEVIGDDFSGIDINSFVGIKFSTSYPSVKFMAVDEDTLGVYVDTDSDGTYETIIADSDGTEYGDSTKPEKPQEGSETVQTSAQQTSTIQPQSSLEQQSAGAGTVSRTEQSEPQASPAAETIQQSSEPVASADYGFVPWVGGALLAAVIAAAVVVMVRKRHGRKE